LPCPSLELELGLPVALPLTGTGTGPTGWNNQLTFGGDRVSDTDSK